MKSGRFKISPDIRLTSRTAYETTEKHEKTNMRILLHGRTEDGGEIRNNKENSIDSKVRVKIKNAKD